MSMVRAAFGYRGVTSLVPVDVGRNRRRHGNYAANSRDVSQCLLPHQVCSARTICMFQGGPFSFDSRSDFVNIWIYVCLTLPSAVRCVTFGCFVYGVKTGADGCLWPYFTFVVCTVLGKFQYTLHRALT